VIFLITLNPEFEHNGVEMNFSFLQGERGFYLQRKAEVNPVRNSSGGLNPVRDLSLNGIDPALRGGTPYGAEPGIILKCNPAAAAGPEGLSPSHEAL
jgi:hypothetical protein